MTAPVNFSDTLFSTQQTGGMTIITHKVTGDVFICGGPTGIPVEHGEYWKRNYTLPVVGTIRTQFLPQNGGQLDYKPISIEELKPVRLVSYIPTEDYEEVVCSLYGKRMPYSDKYLRLSQGQSMVIARYTGPRIEPGERELLPNGKMEFFLLRVLVEHAQAGEGF